MLATHGIALDRSTLAFWVGYATDPHGVVYAYARGRGAVHGLRLLEGTAASSTATAIRLTRP
nr:hypothetical protein [Bradyrhizobium sp. CCBAU 51745]